MFERKRWHRITAILLALTMLFTSIPAMAFAESTNTSEEPDAGQEGKSEETLLMEENLQLEEGISEENIIESESTTESTTFDLGNGKRMIIYHGQDVRYENEEGKLVDYDPSLIELKTEESETGESLSGYAFENRKGDIKHYMPENLKEDTPVITENGKYSISMVPVDETVEKQAVEKEKEPVLMPYEQVEEKKIRAVYKSEKKKHAYAYSSLNQGIKETIILEENPESNVFSFRIRVKGMTAELDEQQNVILFKDRKTEKTVATIDKPFMNDASGEAYSEDLVYALEEEKTGTYLLTLTVSRTYLEDEERIYPVTIDPTATWKGSEEFLDAYVISGDYADINFYDSDVRLMVAGKGIDGTYRTYIKLPNIKSTLADKYIDSAYLTVYESGDCDPDQTIRFNRILESWSVSSITWNNKPKYNTEGYINNFTTEGTQYASHKVKMTNTMRNYVNSTDNPNYGIVMRNVTSSPEFAEFYGSRTTLTSYRPKLVVTYYDKPTVAETVSVSRKSGDEYINSIYLRKGYNKYVSWTGIVSHNLSTVQYKILGLDDTPDPTSVSSDEVDLTSYRSLGVATEDGTNVKIPYGAYLPAGRYRIYIRGKDAGGMYGTAKYKNFYVDAAPTVTDVKVSPSTSSSSKTNNLQPVVSWTSSATHFDRVEVKIGGKLDEKAPTGSGSKSYTVTEGMITKSGDYEIKITAYDLAGNSTSVTKTYYVDYTAPVISSLTTSPSTSSTKSANDQTPTLKWTISDTDLASLTVYVNGTKVASPATTATSWTGSATTFSASGSYTIKLVAKDKAGNSSSKSLTYYLDITKPVITSFTSDPAAASTPNKDNTPTISWKITESQIAKIEYSVDSTTTYIDTKKTAAEGTFTLPALKDGTHTIRLRVTDKAGNISEPKSLTYKVDTTKPAFSSCTLTPSTTSAPSSNAKPVINWKVTETNLKNVSYSIDGATYAQIGTAASGSYTIPADKLTESKAYTIKVKATDTAGNVSSVKTFTYNLDITAPTGNIKTTLQGTGEESDLLSDTINILATATDVGSAVTGLKLDVYRLTETLNENSENVQSEQHVHSFGSATINGNYDFDTTNHANGTYRLKLVVTDKAGNKTTCTKDVIILNRVEAPDVTSSPVNTSESAIVWTVKDATKYQKLQYRLGGSETWIDGYTFSGSETSGTFPVLLPDEDGTYKVYVRGIDMDGEYGKETSVNCILDKTAPIVTLDRFAKGYINGTIQDNYDVTWTVSIKAKTEEDSAYQQIGTGEGNVDNEEISFIDLSDYAADTEYTIKVAVTDIAGNTGEATLEIYKAAGEKTPVNEDAAFRVQRPSYQKTTNEKIKETIIFPTEITTIELNGEGVFGTIKWYVNNTLVSEEDTYQDDFTTGEGKKYQEDTEYHILAIKESLLGEKSYSSNMTKNALRQEIALSSMEMVENEVTTEIDLETSKVLSLNLSEDAENGQTEGVSYFIKTGDFDYVEINPNQKIYIADIFSGIAYAEDLTLKVTVPEGVSLQDVTMDLDILSEEEHFQLSYIENFRPENLSVADKINYKTYVKWPNKITEETPENVYYEVERSTDRVFASDGTNVAATNLRTGYFTEINISYGTGFYYRVRAVMDNGDEKKYSSYSEVVFSSVVDSDEYTKRMGIKEYWEFAEIEMPNGSLNVEKSMGNLVYQQTDVSLPNEQLEVELTRTYNSQSSAKTAFGVGWTHDYDIELLSICKTDEVSDDNIVMKDGSGTIYHFIKNGDEYSSSLGKFISLKKEEKEEIVQIPVRDAESTSGSDTMKDVVVNSAYTVTTKDNLEYRFNSGGQMVYLQESNGNFILFEYEPEKGLLERVVTNRNTAIEFTYNSGIGNDPLTVKQITLPDGSSVEYQYEGDPSEENVRLCKVIEKSKTGEQSISYAYDYDDAATVKEIIDGNGNIYTISYNDLNQVKEVTYPDGESIQLEYCDEAETALQASVEKTLNYEDLNLSTETITKRVSPNNEVFSEIDKFDDFGNCRFSIDAEGNKTTYDYDDHLLTNTSDEVMYHYISEDGYVEEALKEKAESTSYDNAENETLQVEEDGGVTQFGYDEAAPDTWDDYPTTEVETAVINGETKTVFDLEYEYDDAGNETYEHDAVSNTTTITEYYESDSTTGLKGEVKSEKEYLGDPSNEANLQSVTTYTYSYDAEGNKTETTTQLCGGETIVTTVVYDIMGREISNTDSRGKRTDYTYDGLGRLIKTTYTDGDIVTYTETDYDNNGNVVYTRAENGVETRYTFDSMNRETARTITKGSFSKTWTTSYEYGEVTYYTGKGTETETISNAFIVTEKDPEGHETAKTWQNHKGQVVRKLENGIYVDLTYDDQGNVFTQFEIGKEQTDHKGLLTMFIYDDAGNLTDTVLNPVYAEGGFYTAGEETIVQSSEYDDSGNETVSIDGEGYRTQYAYDVEGNVTQVTLPDESVTSVQYDVLNADGTTTDIITDALDRISKTVSDKGDLQTYVEDAGDGTVTPISMSYQYDANENVIKETDAEGNYITYQYDGKDRKIEAQHYDKSGNLTYITRYTYESDASDNLKVMEDYTVADGAETLLRYTWYDYDELDRMTAVAELDGPSVPTASQIAAAKLTYSYDFDDNVTQITYPDHGNGITTVKFEYNAYKWPMKVLVDTESKTDQLVREYAYNNDGKLASVTDYRGVLTGEDGYILKEYGYDCFERVNSITIKDNSDLNTVRESYAYTYDKNSNILTERIVNNYPTEDSEKTNELRTHTYDCNGRLTKTVTSYPDDSSKSPVTYTYSYDAVGNRTAETESGGETDKSTEYVYNSLNQLVSSTETTGETVTSEKTYLYDKTGNQIRETDSKTTEVREQTYDVAGNMTRLVKKKGETVELTQENQYNGNGQRIRKSEADDTTRYFYQNGSVLYTTDGTDNLTSWNLLGSSGAVIGTTRGTGTAEEYYLYTKDIRESTTNIIDDTGAGIVSYQYNDFGETETFGDETFFNEICYTGGIHDASTGIYYLNARYYDPASGVFLSQDSYRGELNDPASLNLYGYCQGNPITYTDPTGHFPWLVAAAWAYRGYKAYKAVKTTTKVVKTTVKVVKTVKTVSKAKKTYKAVKSTKKIVRAAKKAKSSKKIKKIFKKSNTKKIKNKVTKNLKKKTTYKKKNKTSTEKIQKRKNAGCFVAGTKVSTAKGFVPIEKIKAGDRVWAEDTATGKKTLKKVKKIFVREKDSLIRLSVNGEIIETTEEHPFWIKGQGWITAGNLKAGDIVKLQTGEYVPIETYEVVLLKEPIKVYNFHVEDYECYYVSEQKVLVHNNACGEKSKTKGKSFRGGKKSQRDNWYGYNDKNFQRWWHRVGKKEFGNDDIEDSRMAKEAFEEWVERGKPKVR